MAARNIVRRATLLTTDAAAKISEAFASFKTAITTRFVPEIEGEPCEALDPANPFWDFGSEADSGTIFEAGYDDSGAASLHL